MHTKLLAVLALVSVVRSNDVIVGLKSDGTKFFDENRQANPALWRQMDNVTIKAPENEIIRRVVITDLRPEKDGDAKVVEGGEGHKNVTIELKSPTVLRGYDFHIEAYASPDYEDQTLSINGQQSTPKNTNSDTTQTSQVIPSSSETNLDTTSKLPEFSTDKIAPGILSKDEVEEGSERKGRNAKNEDNVTTEGITESTSTTLKDDFSTTPATKPTESVTDNHSENSDDANKYGQRSPVAPIPLNKNINNNPVIPIVNVPEATNNNENRAKDVPRHVRDTDAETTEKPSDKKVTLMPPVDLFKSTTENDKETSTTETSDVKPVEEKSEDNEHVNAPKIHSFENRKYTSFIPSIPPNGPTNPIEIKDETLRNARDAKEEQTFENLSTTTDSSESTTAIIKDVETTTFISEDCATESSESDESAVNNPINTAKENLGPDMVPIYLNSRDWTQRFNNPRIQSQDAINESPKENQDAETLGNDFKKSPDHLENKNSKISAITSFKNNNESPVVSTQ